MPELKRLKPDPIPVIHPVPEHAAMGALAAVYDRTKAGLGMPWMGVLLAVVRLFQWLLPGFALNVAFLRAQLTENAISTIRSSSALIFVSVRATPPYDLT